MRKFKNIIVSIFLVLGIFCFAGQSFIVFEDYLSAKIENMADEDSFSSESSIELEDFYIAPYHSLQTINPGASCEYSNMYFHKFEILHFIWLPPELS
jgi:predicted glycosyltransferase involved in capsule biosynthesis